jgi:CSLREA domain-containing protein
MSGKWSLAFVLVIGLALLIMLALSLETSPAARAVSITVNSTADTVADDGECTLREAIIAANTDAASGGAMGECAAGFGADRPGSPAVSISPARCRTSPAT